MVEVDGGATSMLTHFEITSSLRHGVSVRCDSTLTMQFCRVFQNAMVGVLIANSEGPIEKCQVHENGFSGIQVNAGLQDVRLIENTLYGNGTEQMCIAGSAAPLIEGNRIHDGKEACGISCIGFAKPVIKGNEMWGHPDAHIYMRENASPMIQGNTIRDGGASGIFICDEARPTVEGNVQRRSAVWAAQNRSSRATLSMMGELRGFSALKMYGA